MKTPRLFVSAAMYEQIKKLWKLSESYMERHFVKTEPLPSKKEFASWGSE